MKKSIAVLACIIVVVLCCLPLLLSAIPTDCAFMCFNYDAAFTVCDNYCTAYGHIGCAEVWSISNSCSGDKCIILVGKMCHDGYTFRRTRSDYCENCIPH